MRSFVKKIFDSKIVLVARNLLNFKPVHINSNEIENCESISDAFIWRTDYSYKTVFRYNDLIKYFFNNSLNSVEIFIYDKNFILLKKVKIKKIKNSNELIIDSKLLNNLKDYGSFYIFHKGSKKYKTKIRNSCYTGYSIFNNIPSFVHGNSPAIKKRGKLLINNIVQKSLFTNQFYRVQKKIDTKMKTEIAINNPTSKKIIFFVNEKKFYLFPNCSKIIKIHNRKIIEIRSNCFFLRPLIFTQNGKFLDVHHG